jgi:hypothetical protein
MELLEMLDTVFKCLSTYSHDNPDFPKLKEWLKPHNFSDGEIDDCLKKLRKDEYLYFMRDNKEVPFISDVVGEDYNRNLNYLITMDGKIFLKTIGGYQKRQELEDIKNQEAKNDLETRMRNDRRLVTATVLAGLAATGLIMWEIYKTFFVEHPDAYVRPLYVPDYILGLTTGIVVLLATQYIVLRKKKSKHK